MIGRSDVDAKLKTLASIIKKVSSEVGDDDTHTHKQLH